MKWHLEEDSHPFIPAYITPRLFHASPPFLSVGPPRSPMLRLLPNYQVTLGHSRQSLCLYYFIIARWRERVHRDEDVPPDKRLPTGRNSHQIRQAWTSNSSRTSNNRAWALSGDTARSFRGGCGHAWNFTYWRRRYKSRGTWTTFPLLLLLLGRCHSIYKNCIGDLKGRCTAYPIGINNLWRMQNLVEICRNLEHCSRAALRL